MKLVGVVEASYAAVASGSVDAWLGQTLDAIAPVLGSGRGVFGYLYDAEGELSEWRITEPIVRDGPPELGLATTASFANAPPERLAALYQASFRATTASELQGCTFDELEIPEAAAFAKRLGVLDLVGLHAGDPSARGAMFGAACAKKRTLRPAERWCLGRLGGHLAAAHRLVCAIGNAAPVATMRGDGTLLDVEPSARPDGNQLRASVRAMDRARGAMRKRDPEEALGMWRALVAGRYSLVDRFESDGKRFVIAYENAPGVVDPRGLTGREAAVAALLAIALPDKLIAYELGLAEGTVRTHVHAVLRKLGVRSRAAALARLTPPAVARSLRLGEAEVVVFADEPVEAPSVLTPAEQAVAERAARGKPTAAIAGELGKSMGTVGKQLASAFAKLGVRSRAELAAVLLGRAKRATRARAVR